MRCVIVMLNENAVTVAVVAADVAPFPRGAADEAHKQRRDGATKETIMDDAEHPFGLKRGEPALSVSYRSHKAFTGSTEAARWAGITHARSATPNRRNGTSANVRGSVPLTPYSTLASARTTPRAPARPTKIPTQTGIMPCRTINHSTFDGRAPSARRMPISFVRCETE